MASVDLFVSPEAESSDTLAWPAPGLTGRQRRIVGVEVGVGPVVGKHAGEKRDERKVGGGSATFGRARKRLDPIKEGRRAASGLG